MTRTRTFYEFFAGGGMARAGLGPGWTCLLANDIDPKKASVYERNWGAEGLIRAPIQELDAADLPDRADLAWASFPCQDLSLAGSGAGLSGPRSGTFWAFVSLLTKLSQERRLPRIVALENVVGTLASHGGRDFQAICAALADLGYVVGAFVVEGALFVPQSRPRLFVLATLGPGPGAVEPRMPWHPPVIVRAWNTLPRALQHRWRWHDMPLPPVRRQRFIDVIEDDPADAVWHSPDETQMLLSLMSDTNRAKVEAACAAGSRRVGGVYRRTRLVQGRRTQRAEVRFDDLSGCLRTPAGGSSRQTVLIVEGSRIRSRLLSAREAARLMGLPDDYRLPDRYNDAYHLLGDGVVVPVVRHIAAHLIEPHLDVVPEERRYG